MRFGLRDASEVTPHGASAARATVVTLEGLQLQLELDAAGVSAADLSSAIPTPAADTSDGVFRYDCVNSLLLNLSRAFTNSFNSSLADGLAAIVAEQKQAESVRGAER